jgi:hypothetical protein
MKNEEGGLGGPFFLFPLPSSDFHLSLAEIIV